MRSFGLFCTLLLLGAIPALGQEPSAPPPAHISFVEGTATIVHDGESEPAVLNLPVLDGDRIRTANGRVEVMFADGSSVAIDPDSDVEFLGGTRVRVLAGTLEHRAAVNAASASTQYLPSDLQTYGNDFDRYGSWQYDASYGNVWYPTVAADWRPYYYGYWEPVRSYGWTWIGYDRWSWPTHHYGRWGYARNRWFWIPGRSWAAAWVSWGTAPDYISWCPLGFDGRPVVALSIGYRSGWNAWTVIPRDRFGIRGYSAHRYAIEPYRLASTTPFLIHRSAPLLDRRDVRYGASRSTLAAPRYGRPSVAPYAGSRGVGRFPERRAESRWPGTVADAPRAIPRQPNASPRAVAPNTSSGIRGTAEHSGTYRVPPAAARVPNAWPQRRPGFSDQRPALNSARPSTNDHPAYAPRYQPRGDAPRTYTAPRAEPRVMPQRGSIAPSWRPSAPPPSRQAAPSPSRPAPQAAPSRPSGGPGGGSHARSGGGPSRSHGAAVRRQR